MKIIQINVSKQKLTAKSDFALVAGTVGKYGVRVEYDSEWDELPYRLLMIKGSKTLKVRDDGEIIVIPPECIEKPCYLQFGLIGMDGNGEVRITTYSDSMENTFTVHSSDWKCDSTEDIIGPPSPTIWESLARDIDLLGNEILVCKQDIITNNQQISLLFEMIENLPSGGTGGNITVDSELSTESTNPVQNKIIAQKFGELDKYIEELSRKVEEENVTSESIANALGYTPANQEDVDKLSQEIDDLENKISSRDIVVSKSGTSIVATDSDNKKPKGLKTFGKSTQRTTTGAQLLDFSNAQGNLGTTVKFENDVFIVAGDGKRNYQYAQFEILDLFRGNEGKSLSFGFDSYVSDNSTLMTPTHILTRYNDGTTVAYHAMYNEQTDSYKPYVIPTNIDNISSVELRIYINDSGELAANTVTITKPILYFGTEKPDYEPYTGGIPAPNPEYPQPIENCENIEVSVYESNLISNNWIQGMLSVDNGISINVNDYWVYNEEYIPIDSSKQYMLSSDDVNKCCIYFYDTKKNYISSKQPLIDNKKSIIQPENNAKYARFAYNYNGASEVITPDTIGLKRYIQFELGTTATLFKGYKEKQSLTIPYTLCGIPISSGGNYTDENGQMWCADEVDFARGVYIQRIGKYVLDGNGDISLITAHGDALRFDLRDTINKGREHTGICSHLPLGVIGTQNAELFNVHGSVGFIIIQILSERLSTPDVDGLKAYLASNPMEFYYILAEPIETPLSQKEMDAYKALKTNYPTTTILNDVNAHMEVKYAADTQNHIEQNYVPKSAYTALEARVATLEKNAL